MKIYMIYMAMTSTVYLLICDCFNRWLSLKHNNTVSKIRGHDEIVLNNESSLLSMQNKPA